MKTKRLNARFTTGPVGDHFVIQAYNEVDKKKKKIKEVFTVGHESVSIRLTPETALKLAEFIDKELEDYDYEKRLQKSKKNV